MRRALLLFCLGCSDRPLPLTDPNTPDDPAPDLTSPHLTSPDLAPPDLAEPDLARLPDLARPADLATSCGLHELASYRRPYLLADVTTGDFDGDGHTDFVTASTRFSNFGHGALDFHHGRGDGTFADPVRTVLGDDPTQLVAADFDGDGRSELLLVQGGSQFHTGLYRLSAGGFVESWTSGGSFTDSVVPLIGDADGDGHLDFLTQLDGNLALFPGLGDGSFGAPVVTTLVPPTGTGANLTTLGDLDGDGHADAVVVFADGLHLFRGRGDGHFDDAGVQAPFIRDLVSLAAADLDGDGILDLVADNGGSFPSTQVVHGLGGGRLSTPTKVAAWGTIAHGRELVDLDGDGLPELVGALAWGSGDPGVHVLTRGTDGSFADVTVAGSDGDYPSTAVADFDEDGRPDVIAVGYDDATLTLLLNRGSLQATRLARGGWPGAATLLDVDGDGRVDFLTVDAAGREATLRRGLPGGALGAPEPIPAGKGGWTSLFAGDFDGDHHADLLFANANGSQLVSGRGDGSFAPPPAPFSPGVALGAFGDFNHDGALDVIAPNALYLGRGDGSFNPPLPIPNLRAPLVGDFDGDGLLDVAGTSADSSFQIRRGLGDGSFQISPAVAVGSLWDLKAADVDGDGLLDLIGRSQYPTGGAVAVLLGRGGGGFSAPVISDVTAAGTCLPVDLDGDGKPDLAVVGVDSLEWWHGNGDGSFSRIGSLATELDVGASLVSADLDGDGLSDVVALDSIENSTTVFLNQACR